MNITRNPLSIAWKAWRDERVGHAKCELRPDKGTPLWASDEAPIYYWSADEYDAEEAYYVGYKGSVVKQPKSFGNPRHGYRCGRNEYRILFD
ncbi:MAG: hypothetical protein WA982_06350 [Rubrobacteraceae bacterium]